MPRTTTRTFRRGAWLLGVVAIIAAFVLVVVPVVLEPFHATRNPKWRADVRALQVALAEYAADHGGEYPPTLDALLTVDPRGVPYIGMRCIPRDPWRTEYRYVLPDARHPHPRVWCAGPDGVHGTSDDTTLSDEEREELVGR
jgi:hypothetical protein